jgi:putative ABC transport system permease protein
MSNFKLWKLSIRELRGSFNEFKIVITSIFLGVFIISAVGSLSENLKFEINDQRSELLGGSFELSTTYQEFPPKIKKWLEVNGKTSEVIELRTMLSSNKNSIVKRRLVELKAVDENWPLVGNVSIKPEQSLDQSIYNMNSNGALIDKNLKNQLNLNFGETLNLGDTDVVIKGIIKKEPDRMFSFATFGSRVLLSIKTLQKTNLIIPGSLVKYKIKFIPNEKNINLSYLNKLAEGTSITIRGIDNSTNNFNNFIERTSLFISIVGLITLLISGIGISNGVKGYIIKKIKNIAILKSLGARNIQVFFIYLFQVVVVFLLSIIPALLAGISTPFLLSPIISSELFDTFQARVFFQPIIISFSFGLIICLLFTIIPIARTYEIKPIQLIRYSAHNIHNQNSKTIKIFIFFLICLLCYLTIIMTNEIKLSAYIFTSIVISFIILSLITNLYFYILKKINFNIGSLSELVRKSILSKNSFSKAIVVSFSIGLSLLISLNIIEESLDNKISKTINQDAPNHFLIDIQPNQIETIKKIASASKDILFLNSQPMLRGRITEINDIKVENLKVNKDVEWVLKRDRAFSWTNEIPQNSKLISGKWWKKDYNGPLLVSIGDKIAKGMNIKIGDNIRFNILGRNFEAKIFNTREIIWENMNINFIFVLSESNLTNAPHTWIASSTSNNKEISNEFIEKVVNEFSNISSISIEESYKAIKSILKLLIIIINSIAFITLLSGVIVLAGILDVSKKDKLYEIAILKTLGASPKKISFLWLYEYLIIGLMASLISLLIGCSVSFILLYFVFNIDFYINYSTLIVLSFIVPTLITIFSFSKMFKLILSKPLQVLRSHYN